MIYNNIYNFEGTSDSRASQYDGRFKKNAISEAHNENKIVELTQMNSMVKIVHNFNK